MHPYILFFFLIPPSVVLGGLEKIDPLLLKKIEGGDAGTGRSSGSKEEEPMWNIIVTFHTPQTLKDQIDAATSDIGEDYDKRAHITYQMMQEYNKASQETFIKSITQDTRNPRQIQIQSQWCLNLLTMRSVTAGVIKSMAEDKPEYANITSIHEDVDIKPDTDFVLNAGTASKARQNQDRGNWSLSKIKVELWRDRGFDGTGIIVGQISSGVDYTHPALRDQWVGKEGGGWYDPNGNTTEPNDPSPNSAGTHSLGVILGKGVGVAPGAKWISCIGTPASPIIGPALYSNYLSCGCHMLCPNPDPGQGQGSGNCSNRPHVVYNSWGFSQSVAQDPDFLKGYDKIIKLWRAHNIIPVFSTGNTGLAVCEATTIPADHMDVISVGVTDATGDALADFSGKGPPSQRYTRPEYENQFIYKPDILAPGTEIFSTVKNQSYNIASGSPLGAAHVAGIIALILSRYPETSFRFDQIRSTLYGLAKAAPPVRLPPNQPPCGFRDDVLIPNHKVGYGMVELKDPDDPIFPLPPAEVPEYPTVETNGPEIPYDTAPRSSLAKPSFIILTCIFVAIFIIL